MTNNIIRHVASAFDILARDDINPSQVTNTIVIRNNLLLDVSTSWGGQARTMLVLGGSSVVFDHNTVFTDGGSVVYADVAAVTGFVFTSSIVRDNAWAIMGSGTSSGNGTITRYFPGPTVSRNVFIAGNASTYPTGNFFPSSVSGVLFNNPAGGDYSLAAGSAYLTAATDGTAIGVNQAAILALVPNR